MKPETKNDAGTGNAAQGSFMLPIWVITIITMLGTSFACYAYHGYLLNKRHAENMAEIAAIEARTIKYSEYRDIIINGGKLAGTEYLNKK